LTLTFARDIISPERLGRFAVTRPYQERKSTNMCFSCRWLFKKFFLFASLVFLPVIFAPCSAADDMSTLFPSIEGWVQDGAPQTYTPENLYDYIDGGADLYLSYGFEKLATASYDRGADVSLTVDVYRQRDAYGGFGIYSRERTGSSNFISIGTQGYYEKGMLNFLQGRYYVKIISFGLGAGEEAFLTSVAKQIASRLKDEPVFPKPLLCLPQKDMIKNSEKYISENFLGHGFLSRAFVADYRAPDSTGAGNFQVFIIEAKSDSAADAEVREYLELAGESAAGTVQPEGGARFEDPYNKASGMLNLKWKNKYMWGLFSDDPRVYEFYLNDTENNLKKSGLLN
jgi:hypothetical protein